MPEALTRRLEKDLARLGAADKRQVELDNPRKVPLQTISGMVPTLAEMPQGCRFQNRCPYAEARCQETPDEVPVTPGHGVSCHRWDDPEVTA